jgi:hypothetical protein
MRDEAQIYVQFNKNAINIQVHEMANKFNVKNFSVHFEIVTWTYTFIGRVEDGSW